MLLLSFSEKLEVRCSHGAVFSCYNIFSTKPMAPTAPANLKYALPAKQIIFVKRKCLDRYSRILRPA